MMRQLHYSAKFNATKLKFYSLVKSCLLKPHIRTPPVIGAVAYKLWCHIAN